jgi:dihydroflavonol-4-reductase
LICTREPGSSGSALVTGASGMLGARLVALLTASGWTVNAYLRSTSDDSAAVAAGAIVHRGDITDAESLRSAAEGCSVVFHAAALVPGSGASEDEFHRVNVDGTRNVLDIAVEVEADRVVHVSTVNTIAGQPGAMVDEIVDPPADPHPGYDASKIVAEELAMEYASERLNVVVINPAVMFGPGSRHSGRLIELFLRGRLPVLPLPNRMMSFTYVDDVANGCLLAMAAGRRGERYIVAGPPVSLRDFIGELARVSGRRRPFLSAPAWLVAPGIDILRLASPLTRWQPPVTSKGIRQGGALYDGTKASLELGLEYTPLHQALEATVEWIRTKRRPGY